MRDVCTCVYGNCPADETTLTQFNSSSDFSHAYPLYVGNGLLSPSIRQSAAGLDVLGIMPLYRPTKHKSISDALHTVNRRILAWRCLRLLLAPLFEANDDDEEDGGEEWR